MPFTAMHRYARISPYKARPVIDLIRGLKANKAMDLLKFSHKRAGFMARKVLQSAIANADEKEADVEALYITEATVDEGPSIKRFRPKDRGRAFPIKRRTCHIKIVVDEQAG